MSVTRDQLREVCRVLGYDPEVVALIEAGPKEVDIRVWDKDLGFEITHHHLVVSEDQS